jgi:hypothetical protein
VYSQKADPNITNGPRRIPSVRFAVAGNPRTGSSHLVSLLDSHPDIACWDDEIFDVGEAFEVSSYRDPRDFLREKVFDVSANVVGFKLLRDALNYVQGPWDWLEELQIRVVHTCRENLLDAYISYQLASINNAFTCWYGDYKTIRFEAKFEECLEWFETSEQCDREIRKFCLERSIPRIEIEYNELCKTQERVLEFLNTSSQPLTSQLRKQRVGRQAEIIVNYANLKREFAQSKWAKHFED